MVQVLLLPEPRWTDAFGGREFAGDWTSLLINSYYVAVYAGW